MGTFHVDVEIGDPAGERYDKVSALVDTGSTYTVMPRPLLEQLGVEPRERATFRLADGRSVEQEIGQTWVRIGEKSVITLVVFGESDGPTLLGAYALKGLLLAPDPIAKKLVPMEGMLMTA